MFKRLAVSFKSTSHSKHILGINSEGKKTEFPQYDEISHSAAGKSHVQQVQEKDETFFLQTIISSSGNWFCIRQRVCCYT